MTSHEGDNRAPFAEQTLPQVETSVEAEPQAQSETERREQKLDEAIEMTFPASDPLAI